METDAALKQQIRLNEFIRISGCRMEEAMQFMQAADWNLEIALSMFFQDGSMPGCKPGVGNNPASFPLGPPANTPATPPNFPDALSALSKLSTTDKLGTSPVLFNPFGPTQFGPPQYGSPQQQTSNASQAQYMQSSQPQFMMANGQNTQR